MIASAVGIKSWIAGTPSAEEVRPTHCVGCGAPSRPVGGGVVVHGHGFVERQIRGVLAIGEAPRTVSISARKFECQACGAVMTVVPSELVAGRQYSAPSIAYALYLWLVEGLCDRAVRARVCAWRVAGPSGGRGWAQLYRWAKSAARLFRVPRPVSLEGSFDVVAIRIVTMLANATLASSSATTFADRVFAGAAPGSSMALAT